MDGGSNDNSERGNGGPLKPSDRITASAGSGSRYMAIGHNDDDGTNEYDNEIEDNRNYHTTTTATTTTLATRSSRGEVNDAAVDGDDTDGDGLFLREDELANTTTTTVAMHYSPAFVRVLCLALVVTVIVNCVLAVRLRSSSGSSSSASGKTKGNAKSASSSSAFPAWEPLDWLPVPQPDESTVLTRIAFGSCSNQREGALAYWDTLSTIYKPDLVLLMGDNVYGDCPDEDTACEALAEAYADWASHPSTRSAAQLLPILATLDDHDYGLNNANRNNPHKDVARDMFINFFALDESTLPADGVYRAAAFGPVDRRVQVLLLDTRYARSPFVETGLDEAPFVPTNSSNSNSSNTGGQGDDQVMLSDDQWAWLEGQLEQPATVRLIVSSIQVLNDRTGFECWRHLPAERERLYELLRRGGRHDEELILIVSGDRHMGGYYTSEDGVLKEMTASSWTHTIPLGAYSDCSTAKECDEEDPRRVGNMIRTNHFGALDIDWERRKATVSLRRTESAYGSQYPNYYQGRHVHHDTDSTAIHSGDVLMSQQLTW